MIHGAAVRAEKAARNAGVVVSAFPTAVVADKRPSEQVRHCDEELHVCVRLHADVYKTLGGCGELRELAAESGVPACRRVGGQGGDG